MPQLKQQAIGERVRKLREQRGLSLRGLANATDFSASFMSQVENGLVSPSIDSMGRIASALGFTLGEFFASVGAGEGGLVVRAADRVEMPSAWSLATIEALSPMSRGRLVEPLLITLKPGGRSGKYPSAPTREEFAYVVQGEVDLTLGPETFHLCAGDAVTILRGELRRWVNPAQTPAIVLIVAVL
jgi:XRE family transcriptional regulator, regulator of sulfur utilization